jgi:uncharacterized phosphosugar-binding protein
MHAHSCSNHPCRSLNVAIVPPLDSKEGLTIISTIGIRRVLVGIAAGAKQHDLPVCDVVNRAHCQLARLAHVLGKKLIDMTEAILDNGAPVGNCL